MAILFSVGQGVIKINREKKKNMEFVAGFVRLWII
jgi:hypothetical protein